MKKLSVSASEVGTLQEYLAKKLAISKGKAKTIVDSRDVFVNGKRTWMARHILSKGDQIELRGLEEKPVLRAENLKIKVIHEHPMYIAVNKPAGILTNGPDSLEQLVQEQLDNKKLQAVHRLDRDTSGCVLFSTGRKSNERFELMFKAREIVKIYIALVYGKVASGRSEIARPLDGQYAKTLFKVLKSNNQASLLQVRIETGRTHQIRKHMQMLGHPVLGDKDYWREAELTEILRKITRQMLHAKSVSFTCPWDQVPVRIECVPPSDFTRTARLFGLSRE